MGKNLTAGRIEMTEGRDEEDDEQQKVTKLTPRTGFQTRVQILGDSALTINWLKRTWKVLEKSFRNAIIDCTIRWTLLDF